MQSLLSRYLPLVKRWLWLLLLGVGVCGGTTYAITRLERPVYRASALLVMSVATTPSTYDNTTAALELLPTYVQLVSTGPVLEPVAARHAGLSVKQLSSIVNAKAQSNTQIIEIDVENTNPLLASQLADEIAQSFAQYTTTQQGGIMQSQILPVSRPLEPVRPQPLQDAALGALVGLALACALIVVFEWSEDRLLSPEAASKLLEFDVLTIIPALSRRERAKHVEETPALAESCRRLCARFTALSTSPGAPSSKMVMVTSALAGEGKSTVAANLAFFLATTGKRVLLVDADLRHPVQGQHFQLASQQGLSNLLTTGWMQSEDVLAGQATEIPTLRVLAAGTSSANPFELLQSHTAHQLFAYLNNTLSFDHIILDTPPLLPIADTQLLAAYVQASILVVDVSTTPRTLLLQAKQLLRQTQTHVLGTVLNKSQWPTYGPVHTYVQSIRHQAASSALRHCDGSPSAQFQSTPDSHQQEVRSS